MAKLTRKVDAWIFFLGEGGLLLPMMTAKLFQKKTILFSAASFHRGSRFVHDPLLIPAGLLEKTNRALADHIIVYSPNLIKEWDLASQKHKISIGHEHFLDFGELRIHKQLGERPNLIGYIGRLSEEKGVLNYVKAIPLVLALRDDVQFLIGGSGQSRHEIETLLTKENMSNQVSLPGWIPHAELPNYLNDLKLLVLPSYTEGLPNIILEAMACGTPVLATPVGAIPDLIEDGKTGFIMGNNTSECIAENIMRALNHPNLETVARNARIFVENEFTFEKAVQQFDEMLIQWFNQDT
ncbi:MAG: glycosyltransferase [Dehalococcoidia bacterium]|nr:glycosyltransferase [Dehalococcoidia bacterium]